MRLRTRLAVAFAVLALLPLIVVVPLTLRNVRRTLSREMDARFSAAVDTARSALERTRRDVAGAVSELATSDAVERVARDVRADRAPARQSSVAGELMRSRSLTVLALLDSTGTTLSSGHLPAKLGDADPRLFAVAQGGSADPVVVSVELIGDRGLTELPALVASRPMDYGETRLHVVGGLLLDAAFAQQLAQLTGARVEITAGEQLRAAAGEAEPPVASREVELSPDVALRLSFSRAGLIQVERNLAQAFAALAGIGLSLALLAGLWMARRITRPVESLTEGARRIAKGELNHRVEAAASGEVGELVATFNRMTTELKRTTEQLIASERVAAWQEVAKRLAHEIKNPLTPIKMSLETLIAARTAEHPRFQQLFDESAGAVLEEVERLRRIVDEFSRFARLPKMRLEPASLTHLCEQVLALYASPPPGVRIGAELERNVRALADADALTQVLVNLVKNAEEALSPSGGDVRVRLFTRASEAIIEVEDSGPGIPPEDAERIFEPYFTTKQGGTGLGLAIAARIVQEHGGSLELGRPERGALFRIRVPALSAEAAA